jgi:hypothetical protein
MAKRQRTAERAKQKRTKKAKRKLDQLLMRPTTRSAVLTLRFQQILQ